jgi:hypothetical protein
MNSLHHAATRRNFIPHQQPDQNREPAAWARPSFPAAEMVARMTHRPPETCAEIARLAGFREMEAQ